jgi:uncharacterized protein YraI
MDKTMRRLTILTAGVLSAALMWSSAAAWTGVATGAVNLRSEDSVRGYRLATIPRGALLDVHSCPTWCYLTFQGITGWASPNYIAAADYGPAPQVYYQRPAPSPYYYYSSPPPFFYGTLFPHQGGYPFRHRHRGFGGSGFGIYFGF